MAARGQWPLQLAARLKRRPFVGGREAARLVSDSAAQAPRQPPVADGAAAVAKYPPLVPSRTAKSKSAKRRRQEEYYDKVHAAPSAVEKIRLLTAFQRLKYVVYPQTFAINGDRWYQHFTKTAFVPGLPPALAPSPAEGDSGSAGPDLSRLKSLVCHAILQERFYLKKRQPFVFKQRAQSALPFLRNLVSTLSSTLTPHNPLLGVGTLDFEPEVGFYWLRGERTVPRGHRGGRVDPIRFQIDDKPHCQIRIPKPLPEFMPLEDSVSQEVPVIHLEPDRLPLFQRQYNNNIFIGSKVADPCCYGHTQFHFASEILRRERLIKANLADQIEVRLRANGIASLFAWTGAQAAYQGFWSEADVTRPFVSQAVVTDGIYFSFFCYQLNTLGLTVKADQNNHRKNICWGTESMRLYEAVEEDDIKGFNDEVLSLLVRFLLNRPGLVKVKQIVNET
ncbi:39S ribosomal protein S30, mitochondrial [Callorhinchus milii]|uniref:39S ribosomal protein S30, mitochondrial n=1 Tax=Callorhinchus milii TaxID=7868 RepID=UPI0004574E9E|nr:39S ribosomal protein S30, mitochondrial [Callorhinchus milii]|eukprot:gi/632949876/ref/XP_007890402.1/ PREDICTED: 28S ribosomal protein S30, mitochondrial [Callorhinchus milii]